MELYLSLACDSARQASSGTRIDVRGAFNDLFAPGFPAVQSRMVIVAGIEWDRSDEGSYRFRVDLLDPSGKPCLTAEGETRVDRRPPDRPPARTCLIMPVENVVFPVSGTYRFSVRAKGRVFRGTALHLFRDPDAAPRDGREERNDRESGDEPARVASGAGAEDARRVERKRGTP